MKWFPAFFGFLLVFFPPIAAAQESLDWDIDSVFDAIPAEPAVEEPGSAEPADNETGAEEFSAAALVKQRGFTFDAAYDIYAGIAPGWDETPWIAGVDREFSKVPGAKMRASFALDARISEVFRVKSGVYFEIPNYRFRLDEFFFDYSVFDTVFFRAGKYSLSWGISPNYGFTNLLARLPAGSSGGEPYIAKAEIPVGIGGIQLLAQTRTDMLHGIQPGYRDVGMGGKYNLALRWADIDMGAFYQDGMPLRGFLSIKTTAGNTELYHEWLAAVDVKHIAAPANGAANIGFVHNFFDRTFTVNGELFLNAEKGSFWYRPETSVRDPGTVPFVEGLNAALNLIYRPGLKGNPRLFVQTLYAPLENSAQLVPGFRLSPLPHLEFSAAVPMALGSRDGHYYSNTADLNNRPFSIVLLLSLSGSTRYAHNF